jgi:hypothetical protein
MPASPEHTTKDAAMQEQNEIQGKDEYWEESFACAEHGHVWHYEELSHEDEGLGTDRWRECSQCGAREPIHPRDDD